MKNRLKTGLPKPNNNMNDKLNTMTTLMAEYVRDIIKAYNPKHFLSIFREFVPAFGRNMVIALKSRPSTIYLVFSRNRNGAAVITTNQANVNCDEVLQQINEPNGVIVPLLQTTADGQSFIVVPMFEGVNLPKGLEIYVAEQNNRN